MPAPRRLIRPMSIDDIPPCLELWVGSEGLVLRDEYDHPLALERFLQRNPRTSFVATQDHQIIGGLLGGHDGRRGYLYHLAVQPEQRRSGCATALFEASALALAHEGIGRCHAYVTIKNVAAQKFWESVSARRRDDIFVMTC